MTATNVRQSAWSLRRRLTVGLLGYIILLTLGVLANDFVVNESAEKLVWESLLTAELDHFLKRRQQDPDYSWPETETLHVFAIDAEATPHNPLLRLAPGVHDEILLDGREKVVLIEDADDQRFVIALDITDLEGREAQLRNIIFLSAFIVTALLGCAAVWGTGRLIQPLQVLSDRIGALDPAKGGQLVALPANASSELTLITEAINGYIVRNAAFMDREQAFIRVASHELRTPLSIIAGAATLALGEPGTTETMRNRLRRIVETTSDTNELVTLLLVLAKDPARLTESSEAVKLHSLLPQIVQDHQHLAQGKEVAIVLGTLPEYTIDAPLQIVKSAIGNLLRNAIENTRNGDVQVSLSANGTVIIEDQGAGISAEKISELYTRLARSEGTQGGGIGLTLITRLCEHLNWTLSVDSNPGDGTRVALHFPSPAQG
ncbi:MAG: HAMP domain-containing sensor histidine kinase [Porticoccaceae bacterium]